MTLVSHVTYRCHFKIVRPMKEVPQMKGQLVVKGRTYRKDYIWNDLFIKFLR